MTAHPLITLLTDFGLVDPYVGVMKGVILGICPEATILDLTHAVSPRHVASGAFLLGTAYRYFPPATVHVAVVDPGVGSERRPLLLETPRGRFVAPDNGLLSYVLRDAGATHPPGAQPFAPLSTPVPSGCRAYHLANHRYWLQPVSHTFHGRDVFAPVAAHLARGVTAQEMGSPVLEVTALALPVPRREGDLLVGQVVHVDRFGNLVTNIPAGDVPQDAVVEVAGCRIHGLVPSYAAGPALLAIIGSHGYLEVSARNGSAARELDAGVGAIVMCLTQKT